jgi:hypothetical protein
VSVVHRTTTGDSEVTDEYEPVTIPNNLTEIQFDGKDAKARFVAILQKHSLGQPLYYWFFSETFNPTPQHALPCYKAYIGLRANLLDENSMIWFANTMAFNVPDEAMEENIGEAMNYLRDMRARYLAAMNGKGGNRGNGGLWLPEKG